MNIRKEYLASAAKLVFILSFFTISNFSFAKFLVEPVVKSYNGNYQRGDNTGKFSGQIFGLNLGYIGESFMAGLALENGQFTSDNSLTNNTYREYKGGGVGTFLGFHFYNKLKVWTGYLNSSLEPTRDNDFRYFGQHVSFGIGYRLVEGLIFNIEGFRNQYTQQENDLTGKTTGLDSNIKTEGISYFLSYMLVF